MEAAAMTAGPVRNRTAIANEATEFPHAIILGCRAINKPMHMSNKNSYITSQFLPKMEQDQKGIHPQLTFTLSSLENSFQFRV